MFRWPQILFTWRPTMRPKGHIGHLPEMTVKAKGIEDSNPRSKKMLIFDYRLKSWPVFCWPGKLITFWQDAVFERNWWDVTRLNVLAAKREWIILTFGMTKMFTNFWWKGRKSRVVWVVGLLGVVVSQIPVPLDIFKIFKSGVLDSKWGLYLKASWSCGRLDGKSSFKETKGGFNIKGHGTSHNICSLLSPQNYLWCLYSLSETMDCEDSFHVWIP